MGEVIGVVGSSGAVGAEIIRLVSSRQLGFAVAGLRLFARRAAGTIVDCGRLGEVTVESFTVAGAQQCTIVLMAVSGSFATEYARQVAGGPRGTVVIDNSSAFRYTDGIPLVRREIIPQPPYCYPELWSGCV